MRQLFEDFKTIETSRLLIRELQETDYKDLYEIFSDEEVVKYQQIPAMPSVEVSKQATLNFIKGYQDKLKIRRSIVVDNKMVGIISLHSFDYENRSVELGFMLNREYWQKGIMTEAAIAMIDYLKKNTNAKLVVAKPRPENIASIKVCEKIGLDKVAYEKNAILNFVTEEYDDQLVYQLELSN